MIFWAVQHLPAYQNEQRSRALHLIICAEGKSTYICYLNWGYKKKTFEVTFPQ